MGRVKLTVAVFEIVAYSLTHYFLYSVYDIVNYTGTDENRSVSFNVNLNINLNKMLQ